MSASEKDLPVPDQMAIFFTFANGQFLPFQFLSQQRKWPLERLLECGWFGKKEISSTPFIGLNSPHVYIAISGPDSFSGELRFEPNTLE